MRLKLVPIALISLLLLAALVLCEVVGHSGSLAPDPAASIRFCINGKETVGCWKKDEGHYYAFLPSYADLDKTTVILADGQDIVWGGIPLTQGMRCSDFEVAKEHELLIDGSAGRTLTIMRSANVATMYIETMFNSMDAVHKDKRNTANTGIRLYTAQGDLNYRGSGDDKIRGHGNSTWELDKKSYNLSLAKSQDLLRMGSGVKWVLLANGIDATNLRNKVIFDFANNVGAYDGFAPHASFVDLYLNGEYQGLYLLTESVATAAGRSGLGKGGVLFNTELSHRVQDAAAFEINPGVSVEVDTPKVLAERQRTALQGGIADLQEGLLADAAGDARGWEDYVDVDSWARKYLVEEVFLNYDAGAASQYYAWDEPRGVFVAGPCWDYDNTLGLSRHKDPHCFLAQREWKNDGVYTPWFHALMNKPAFRDHVTELYKDTFRPALQRLLDETLPGEGAAIAQPAILNETRWGLRDASAATRRLGSFLRKRFAFLDRAWIDGARYHTITLKGKGDYCYYSVFENETCAELPSPKTYGYAEDAVWYCEDTNEPFDRSTVLSEDITLYARVPDAQDVASVLKRILKRTAIPAVMAVLLVVLIVVDVRRRVAHE